MFEIFAVSLLLFLIIFICVMFGVVGFFVGKKYGRTQKRKPQDNDTQAEIKKKKIARELENFYSYTGDEQG